MASGWANDDAVNQQINNTIEDAVARARGELPTGKVCMNAKNVAILSLRPDVRPCTAYACASLANRIKIHIVHHFQDIIAEVRKTASYVDSSLPKVSAHTLSFTSTLFALCVAKCAVVVFSVNRNDKNCKSLTRIY